MLRTTTAKKPLLARLWGWRRRGGGGVVGERDPRSKGKNVLEQEREPQQSSTNILYGVASGIWTQATIAPQYFTAWQFINSLSTTNLTVSDCKTAIDLYPPPRLPLGIPEKKWQSYALSFFPLSSLPATQRDLCGGERLLLTSHWTSVNQMRQMIGRGKGTFREKGKITKNQGGENIIALH